MYLLVAWILSLRMMCLRLDVTVRECLDAWRHRAAIGIMLEDREQTRHALVGRIDEMYPF